MARQVNATHGRTAVTCNDSSTSSSRITTTTAPHPGIREGDNDTRIRHDRVDKTGCITLRAAWSMHHIGLNPTPDRTSALGVERCSSPALPSRFAICPRRTQNAAKPHPGPLAPWAHLLAGANHHARVNEMRGRQRRPRISFSRADRI